MHIIHKKELNIYQRNNSHFDAFWKSEDPSEFATRSFPVEGSTGLEDGWGRPSRSHFTSKPHIVIAFWNSTYGICHNPPQ